MKYINFKRYKFSTIRKNISIYNINFQKLLNLLILELLILEKLLNTSIEKLLNLLILELSTSEKLLNTSIIKDTIFIN